jgi:undecaprenyl-diphosphatase
LLYAVLRNCTARKAVATVLCIVLAIVLADQFCGHLLRPAVGRLRPANPDNPLSELAVIVNGYRGGTYGFPSCHAANSFALAVFTALLVRSRRVAAFIIIWAVVNSYSRLYLGVHYPGDLFVGAVFGSIFGALCFGLSDIIAPASQYSDKPLWRSLRTSDAVMLAGIAIAAGIAVYSLII